MRFFAMLRMTVRICGLFGGWGKWRRSRHLPHLLRTKISVILSEVQRSEESQ